MFGLTSKTAWVFLTILGIFVGIVAFGNIVGPRTTSLAQAPSEPIVPKTSDNSVIGDVIAQPPPSDPSVSPESTAMKTPDAEPGNLTKSLASMIGKSIVEKNPEGPKNDTFTVEGTESMVDRMLTASSTTLDLTRFSPAPSEISFTTDASATEGAYRSAVAAIRANQAIPIATASMSVEDAMNALAHDYEAAANKLRAVSAPPTLAGEHRSLIISLLTKKRMLEAAAHYNADPAYAILVLNALETME